MRKALVASIAIALVTAFPAGAFAGPRGGYAFEGQSAWADYVVDIEGLGTAYVGVGGFSGSFSEGEYSDEWSEASVYIFGDGFDCYASAPADFDLGNRLSGASVSADLEGGCFFWEGNGGEGEEGEPEFTAEHDEEGEPEVTAITIQLSIEFVGVGAPETSNGFWRDAQYKCSDRGKSRDATTTGTANIQVDGSAATQIDLSGPESAQLSVFTSSCQMIGRPGH